MNQVLEVRDLTKQYPSFLLDHLSFTLEEGKITGFIGRNGAGKTTTIHSLLGLVHPDAGEISFYGLDYPKHDREIKEKIGFVSAGMTYYTRRRLKEITGVTRTFYRGWDDSAYQKWLDLFGLEDSKTPSELSNGMKIKYALALALSHGAELLILDEPTSGLDPVSREELVEVFLKLKDEGKTIFFSTHITSDLENCADRILFLQQGILKADDSLEDYKDAWRIVKCGDEIPLKLKQISCGSCRTRDGYTVLIRKNDAGAFDSMEASLEEIMVHLEKEAEEA